ncbi:hypothetical protein ACWEGS_32715 [Streptomyces sp. NPDC004822]
MLGGPAVPVRFDPVQACLRQARRRLCQPHFREQDALAEAKVSASGERADLGALLPLMG